VAGILISQLKTIEQRGDDDEHDKTETEYLRVARRIVHRITFIVRHRVPLYDA
jgi:hypothetical protein